MTQALVLLGGPALYLVGNATFNRTLTGRRPSSRLLGVAALAAAASLAWFVNLVTLAGVAAAIVLALAILTGAIRGTDLTPDESGSRA